MPKPSRKRNPAIKGITLDAEALGVTRTHLYLVLTGNRESKPLLKRYRALKREQKKAQQQHNLALA